MRDISRFFAGAGLAVPAAAGLSSLLRVCWLVFAGSVFLPVVFVDVLVVLLMVLLAVLPTCVVSETLRPVAPCVLVAALLLGDDVVGTGGGVVWLPEPEVAGVPGLVAGVTGLLPVFIAPVFGVGGLLPGFLLSGGLAINSSETARSRGTEKNFEV